MKRLIISEMEKIKIRKMYGLINEEPLMKSSPSWYNANVCFACQNIDSYNLEGGAYGVQQFLIQCGHKISIDGDFGDKTATALGTWVYGANAGINTVVKLAEKMKKDGWDIGTVTNNPYGPKMAYQVAKLIKQLCTSVHTSCQKQTNLKRKSWATDRQNFNPQTNSYFADLKKRCEAFLNEKIPIVKQKFVSWVNSPKTLKKLNPLPIQLGFQNNLPIENLKKVVYSINRNTYNCQGPFESEDLFKSKNINGYYNPTTNKVTLNYEVNFPENKLEKTYSTLIHETTHWVEGNLPLGYRQTINRRDKVRKVYPLSVKDKWESDFMDNQFFYKVSISDVSQKSISEFNQIGVGTYQIESFIDAWNLELTSSINDKNGLKEIKYNCGRDEKEANLKTVRELYTGSLEGELTTKNLKDIMNQKYDSLNEYSFIICWAGNAFNPSPLEFLKLSNELAVNETPTDNDTSNNIDFSDIDPQS